MCGRYFLGECAGRHACVDGISCNAAPGKGVYSCTEFLTHSDYSSSRSTPEVGTRRHLLRIFFCAVRRSFITTEDGLDILSGATSRYLPGRSQDFFLYKVLSSERRGAFLNSNAEIVWAYGHQTPLPMGGLVCHKYARQRVGVHRGSFYHVY